jgi:hypothetical protein
VAEIEAGHESVRKSFSKTEANLDAKVRTYDMDVNRLREEEKKLVEEKYRLEMEKEMWKPAMIELETTRSGIEARKREIESLGASLDDANKRVAAKLIDVETRENDVDRRERVVAERERSVESNRKEFERNSVMLNQQLTTLQQERLSVYEDQIKVKGQVVEVKRVMGVLKGMRARIGNNGSNRSNNMAVMVYGDDAGGEGEGDENHNHNHNHNNSSSVSQKAMVALEAAVDRASRNLEEIALRSKQTMGEVRVPVEKVDRVVAGVERNRNDDDAAVRSVEEANMDMGKKYEKIDLSSSSGSTTTMKKERSVRQIMGGAERVGYSKESDMLAMRMREIGLVANSSTGARGVRW